MTIDEYFGDWMKVLDRKETMKIVGWLNSVDREILCPSILNVFKAFKLCPYNKCRIIFVGQDPYPQKGVAQGLLFSNSSNTPDSKLSPSLQIIKESVINFEIPHNYITFDPTLESWATQGILLLNASLTTEVGKVGIHTMNWKPFIIALLKHMSSLNPGIIYVLFGSYAQMFKPFISNNNTIFIEKHPAFYARTRSKMPYRLWQNINRRLVELNGDKIEWYKEEKYGEI